MHANNDGEVQMDLSHNDETQLRKLIAELPTEHPANGMIKALTENPELVVPALAIMVSTTIVGLAGTQQHLDKMGEVVQVLMLESMKRRMGMPDKPKPTEAPVPSAGNATRYGTGNGGYL